MKKKHDRPGRPTVDNPRVNFTVRVDPEALKAAKAIHGRTLNQKINQFLKRLAKTKV